ncbi:hypothetical protein BJ165DRAFT_1526278 [Panaeolus papilionaceus]|nr:hypothetical protein BJ165DRAFT_1526278 [Panaeolus papilionaceus]
MDLTLQELADSVKYTRIVSYVNAGTIAIIVYDYLQTLDREIRTIWSQKWNYTKFLFILTRYSTLLEAFVVTYQLSVPGEWYSDCSTAFKANAWLFVLGLGVGEMIMTIRTWAIWGKNRVLMWCLPMFYLAVWVSGFAVTGIFLQTLEFGPNPRTPYVGCYATYVDPIIFFDWILLLFYDAVMFVLVLIPAWKVFRGGGTSQLLIVVYRDGLIYYLYLFALSFTNIMVIISAPGDLILLLSLFSRALHGILACRVVLHIDEHARPVQPDTPEHATSPSFQFKHSQQSASASSSKWV